MSDESSWTRVEALFQAAMERPQGRRARYIKDSAASELECEEVIRLINAAQNAGDFLSTSIGLDPFIPSLDIGTVIKGWKIVSVLGAGGMGEVYRVTRDRGDYEHETALKLARTDEPKYIKRFNQERQLLARLEHPNIGRLIDGGDTDGGFPFMVMELIDGAFITDHAHTQNLSEKARLRLFLQLCDAVSHAHGRLVLHRDIKPANVLVTSSGQVKLIDFGVSYDIGDETAASTSPVTSAYAAPEQISGDNVSTATDIYALGSLLHEMLTSKRYEAEIGLSDALPNDLCAVLGQCLQTRPEDRYASAEQLSADVNRYLRSEPVTARDGGSIYRLGRLVKRNALTSTIFGLLFISLISGITASLLFANRATLQAERALTALAAAEKAERLQEFEARTLSGYKYGLQTLYGGDEGAGDNIDPEKIDASLMKLVDEAEVQAQGGSLEGAFTLYALSQHFKNRLKFAPVKEILERLLAANPDNIYLATEAKSDLARALSELGEKEQSVIYAREALKARATFEAYHATGRVQDALTIAEITNDAADSAYVFEAIDLGLSELRIENDYDDMSFLYNQKGLLHYRNAEMVEATNAFEKSFELDRHGGARSPDHITSATNLAQFQLFFKRDGAQILNYMPDYIPFTQGEFGDDPLGRGYMYGLIALAALQEDKTDAAISAGEKAVALQKADKTWSGDDYYVNLPSYLRALSRGGQAEKAKQLAAVERGLWDGTPPSSAHSDCNMRMADVEIDLALTGLKFAQSKLKDAIEFCKKLEDPKDVLDLDKVVIVEQIERQMKQYR